MARNKTSIDRIAKEIKGAGFPYIKIEVEATFRRREIKPKTAPILKEIATVINKKNDVEKKLQKILNTFQWCCYCNTRTLRLRPERMSRRMNLSGGLLFEAEGVCHNCGNRQIFDGSIPGVTVDKDSWGKVFLLKHKYPPVLFNAVVQSYIDTGSLPMDGNPFNDFGFCKRVVLNQLTAAERKKIIFCKFYNDGSVDSELTYTLRTEDMALGYKIMKAFHAIATISGHCVTGGAGLHLTVMKHKTYPTRARLSEEKISNFKEQMNYLMPGLFLLASPSHISRRLNFRKPQATNSTKYSAIYTKGDSVIEFRLFETCYDKPETLYDYFEVIANSLKYYKDPSLKAPRFNIPFFFKDGNNLLSRFYPDPDAMIVLREQVKLLKPKGKSLKAIGAERSIIFGHEGEYAKRQLATRKQKLLEEYLMYVKRHNKSKVVLNPNDVLLDYTGIPRNDIEAMDKPQREFMAYKILQMKKNVTKTVIT